MRIKIFTFAVILLIITVVLYYIKTQDLNSSERIFVQDKTLESKDLIAEPIIPTNENIVMPGIDEIKPSQEEKQQIDELINEISEQKYSEDPIVEAMSLSLELWDCKSQVNKINSYYRWLVDDENNKPAELLKKALISCDNKKKAYPNLALRQNPKDLMSTLNPSTELGELVQQIMTVGGTDRALQKDLEKQIYFRILKEKNAQLLSTFASISLIGGSMNRILPINEIIGGIDEKYLQMVTQEALMLMSCEYQGGETCSAISSFMTGQCIKDSNACGLDLKTWINQTFDAGHLSDINKIIDYVNSL